MNFQDKSLVSSAMITLHGGTYLAHRTECVIQARAIKGAIGAALVLELAFVAAGIWLQWIPGFRITSLVDPAALPDPMNKTVVLEAGAWMSNYARQPLLWLLPALAIVGVTGTAGASMFPFIMPSSTLPAASLTVWDRVSTHLTLGIMFWATMILMPLIVVYTSWAYSVMRGKVAAAYIQENDHAAY